MTDFITAKEAAEMIGVSPSTIGIWIQTGQLEGKKVSGIWTLRREVAEAKAATYIRPVTVPTERTRIVVSTKPPAKAGIISPETIARAKETVIAHWSDGMPEATARRLFGELLETAPT